MLEPEAHVEDMDVDVPNRSSPSNPGLPLFFASSSSIIPALDVNVTNGSLPSNPEPLFFASSSSVIPSMDNMQMLEEDTASKNASAPASKGKKKKKDTKSSTKAKGKKSQKQVNEVELDEFAQKSVPDKAVTGNDDLAEDDLVEEEAPKVSSKKKAPPKPKAKSKAKGKGKAILSESENDEDDPRSKPPIQRNQLPEDQESLADSPKKDSRVIRDAESSKVLPLIILTVIIR
jgi:hypothetical protein